MVSSPSCRIILESALLFLSEIKGDTVDQNDLTCLLQFLEKYVAIDFLRKEVVREGHGLHHEGKEGDISVLR